VPQLRLTWLTAGIIAAVLFGVGALVSAQLRRGRVGPAIREAGVVVGLFALWLTVGHLVGHHPRGGYSRGLDIWRAERWLHLDIEPVTQTPLLHSPALATSANYYYAYAHWASVDAVLAWLWWRHRGHYAVARNALVLFTGSCLLLHLISTAPPRLLAQTGVVDVGARLGQSVYGDAPGVADHLSAMPSIHVGWAVLFAIALWRTGSATARALGSVHVALTSYVVMATGNHFWLDGAVAAVLAAVAVAVATYAWQDRARDRSAVGVGVGPDPAGGGGQAPRPRRQYASTAGDAAP
jgi:hypothetical protein